MTDFDVKVVNVVAFVTLGKPIPLNKLIANIENAEYEPEQFPGLIYRTTEPRAAALIFSSGKIVCTGAKSIDLAHVAIAKVVERVRKVGIALPKTYDVTVENIVASASIDANLNLEEITFLLENAEYEPEQFPGLVYRISKPRVAFLLFSSGKIICTGARTVEDIYTALDKLKEKLESVGIKVKGGSGKPSKPKAAEADEEEEAEESEEEEVEEEAPKAKAKAKPAKAAKKAKPARKQKAKTKKKKM